MTRRPPKGRGADIFLGEADTPPVQKRRIPKGRGAEVFLGAAPGPSRARPPKPAPVSPSAPADLTAGLDRLHLTLKPAHGHIGRSHLVVLLWLGVALKEAGV